MNILYCGDDERASKYLLGALDYLGHHTTHVPPEMTFPGVYADTDTLILSDYPARNITQVQSEAIAGFVSMGGRLLMLGGWESFNGLGQNYYDHPVSKLLPVELQSNDDRMQQALVVRPTADTRQIYPLSWDSPPIICGYNAASVKPHARVLVEMAPVRTNGEDIRLEQAIPLVTAATHDKGISVACQTDLAPHWSGTLGDWGESRLTLSTGNEVGSDYPEFLRLLLEV
jgi:uncharacterized membrane protein